MNKIIGDIRTSRSSALDKSEQTAAAIKAPRVRHYQHLVDHPYGLRSFDSFDKPQVEYQGSSPQAECGSEGVATGDVEEGDAPITPGPVSRKAKRHNHASSQASGATTTPPAPEVNFSKKPNASHSSQIINNKYGQVIAIATHSEHHQGPLKEPYSSTSLYDTYDDNTQHVNNTTTTGVHDDDPLISPDETYPTAVMSGGNSPAVGSNIQNSPPNGEEEPLSSDDKVLGDNKSISSITVEVNDEELIYQGVDHSHSSDPNPPRPSTAVYLDHQRAVDEYIQKRDRKNGVVVAPLSSTALSSVPSVGASIPTVAPLDKQEKEKHEFESKKAAKGKNIDDVCYESTLAAQAQLQAHQAAGQHHPVAATSSPATADGNFSINDLNSPSNWRLTPAMMQAYTTIRDAGNIGPVSVGYDHDLLSRYLYRQDIDKIPGGGSPATRRMMDDVAFSMIDRTCPEADDFEKMCSGSNEENHDGVYMYNAPLDEKHYFTQDQYNMLRYGMSGLQLAERLERDVKREEKEQQDDLYDEQGFLSQAHCNLMKYGRTDAPTYHHHRTAEMSNEKSKGKGKETEKPAPILPTTIPTPNFNFDSSRPPTSNLNITNQPPNFMGIIPRPLTSSDISDDGEGDPADFRMTPEMFALFSTGCASASSGAQGHGAHPVKPAIPEGLGRTRPGTPEGGHQYWYDEDEEDEDDNDGIVNLELQFDELDGSEMSPCYEVRSDPSVVWVPRGEYTHTFLHSLGERIVLMGDADVMLMIWDI